jgi:hypothetical protein
LRCYISQALVITGTTTLGHHLILIEQHPQPLSSNERR